MKKLLLALGILFLTQNSFAQCDVSVTGFGNNNSIARYNVSGDLNVIYDDETREVTVQTGSNYSTASGPDVRVFLINSNGRSNAELVDTNPFSETNISFGLIGFNGVQTLKANVAEGVNIGDFDTVFFYCLQFRQFWDFGKYTAIDASTCNNLSFDRLEKVNDFNIYPIPAQNQININGDVRELTQYTLYNSVGQIVKQGNQVENALDVSDLPRGFYSLTLFTEDSFEVEKIILN